jgi:DedD protein
MRDLEQIQETDTDVRGQRTTTWALLGLGTACVAFAVLALNGRKTATDVHKTDPLAELVRDRAKASGTARTADLTPRDVTFPGLLSDKDNPTTALAAVRSVPTNSSSVPPAVDAPPPATDRLAVVALPAQSVLQPSPVVTRPRDSLSRAAQEKGDARQSMQNASMPGRDGGYQLQVSSFRNKTEADGFSDQLRARGHKAYVLEAAVPGRGTWYRVRIGPFPSQHLAVTYRSGFETKEHVVPFVVPPAK